MMARLNVILLVALVICALALVTSRHQSRKLFVELERERTLARNYDIEYGQLQIEQSTWAMPARIEKIARDKLRMQLPGASRIEVMDEATR
jgi:cell division protein FtsL